MKCNKIRAYACCSFVPQTSQFVQADPCVLHAALLYHKLPSLCKQTLVFYMLLFCTTNFPVCASRPLCFTCCSFVPQTSQFVQADPCVLHAALLYHKLPSLCKQTPCVFRKFSPNTTGCSQNCVHPVLAAKRRSVCVDILRISSPRNLLNESVNVVERLRSECILKEPIEFRNIFSCVNCVSDRFWNACESVL